jgi:hypothetical protein
MDKSNLMLVPVLALWVLFGEALYVAGQSHLHQPSCRRTCSPSILPARARAVLVRNARHILQRVLALDEIRKLLISNALCRNQEVQSLHALVLRILHIDLLAFEQKSHATDGLSLDIRSGSSIGICKGRTISSRISGPLRDQPSKMKVFTSSDGFKGRSLFIKRPRKSLL